MNPHTLYKVFFKSTKLMRKIRLLVPQASISIAQNIEIRENDFDYLTKVMRKKLTDEIYIFNGLDGEFQSKITQIEKKFLVLEVCKKTADIAKSANITLSFALLKNVKNEFIATKATELGVAKLQPMVTKRTIVDKMNLAKFKLSIKEACEQCERNDVPEALEVKKLDALLADPSIADKVVILCDESGKGQQAKDMLPKISLLKNQEIMVLIGPEGGFSPEEFDKMAALPNVYSLSLGPRILRADTAILASLTLVQEFLGDFHVKPVF